MKYCRGIDACINICIKKKHSLIEKFPAGYDAHYVIWMLFDL